MVTSHEPAPRTLRLRYAGVCVGCQAALPAGTEAWWDPGAHSVTCAACLTAPADPFPAPSPPPPSGTAGRSAQEVGDRRLANREARIRERFPRLGDLILILSDPPRTSTVWGQGAEGERKVAGRLAKPVAEEKTVVLHDRRVPGTKGNIDHLVIGATGVFVVDTKRYLEKRVERRNGTLFVGGRDQSKLVEKMGWQIDRVRRAVDDLGARMPVPVQPVLCFVDSEWGWSDSYRFGDVVVDHPKGLVRRVTQPGPFLLDDRLAIAHHLAERFPEA